MQRRTLNENLIWRMLGTPATWAAAAAYTNWVQLAGKGRRAIIVAGNGELDANLVMELFEAQDGTGTGAQELTDVTTDKSFVNGTDEGKIGLFEVLDSDLSAGYTHVGLKVTPGATDSFAAFIAIGDLYEAPASNAAADGVAFNVGE